MYAICVILPCPFVGWRQCSTSLFGMTPFMSLQRNKAARILPSTDFIKIRFQGTGKATTYDP